MTDRAFIPIILVVIVVEQLVATIEGKLFPVIDQETTPYVRKSNDKSSTY